MQQIVRFLESIGSGHAFLRCGHPYIFKQHAGRQHIGQAAADFKYSREFSGSVSSGMNGKMMIIPDLKLPGLAIIAAGGPQSGVDNAFYGLFFRLWQRTDAAGSPVFLIMCWSLFFF